MSENSKLDLASRFFSSKETVLVRKSLLEVYQNLALKGVKDKKAEKLVLGIR